MAIQFVITKKGLDDFDGLPKDVRARMMDKLNSLKSHPDIMTVIKRLQYISPPTYSLRVGSYRVLLNIEKEDAVFLVSKIGHRRDIYHT